MATSDDSGKHAASMAAPAWATPADMDDGSAHAASSGDALVAPFAAAISVVLITHGELDQLDRSLDALLRQDLPASYDIVVVEDHPDPATARMAAAWSLRNAGQQTRHDRGARLHYLPNHGPARGAGVARNLGWRAASAAVVAFTDDDAVATVDWLRQGLAALGSGAACADSKEGPPEAVFGGVNASLPRHPTEIQRQLHERFLATQHHADNADYRDHRHEVGQLAGCNWFCRRSLLERLGGFDERFVDASTTHTDLYFRLLEGGVRVLLAPAARVAHPLPAPFWWASLAQLRALTDDALLYKKHPRLYRQTIRRPPEWYDLAVVAFLLLGAGALWRGHELLGVAAGGTWLVLTSMLCIRRLHGTAKTASHIAAVVLTSPVMPPLALFWRLVGALRHRVRYA